MTKRERQRKAERHRRLVGAHEPEPQAEPKNLGVRSPGARTRPREYPSVDAGEAFVRSAIRRARGY
jgi:hypothetical protein